MANTNSTKPKPPNHCVMLLHKRIEAGNHSTALNTVAPVEVIPDVDSNRASGKLSRVPVARKGKVPKRESTTHISTTNR